MVELIQSITTFPQAFTVAVIAVSITTVLCVLFCRL